MIVDCAEYQEGRRAQDAPLSVDAAAAICGNGSGGFVWMGIVDPSPEELEHVRERFGLHELAVEDAQNFHLRPKIEKYDDDVYFVVLRTARDDPEHDVLAFGEVSMFIGPRFVITVRQGIASDLHPARLRLERRPELLAEGPISVLWAVLDQIVDDYAPVVEAVERDIEAIEASVFSGESAPTERIYKLRREATDFYRAVHPLLGPLNALEQGAYPEIGRGLRQYFRDVNDHAKLVNEEVLAQRDLLATILQANMAVITLQQNDVVRKISGWAAIIAVPTFIASLYGMNFDHMPETDWKYGYVAVVALILAIGAGLYAFLRRIDWL
ncbi:MAG TPA: magnesium/cobalt transporter CorA [Solirubrobacteraceae bacterium]|nr:magnesium/cobalt transporter CorA [Solirubrobacteraceae bacterium]